MDMRRLQASQWPLDPSILPAKRPRPLHRLHLIAFRPVTFSTCHGQNINVFRNSIFGNILIALYIYIYILYKEI